MTASPRSSMIAELLTDYVEERVRQFPKAVFDLAGVKRSLSAVLKDGQAGFDLVAGDDRVLTSLLDQHPFLVRAGNGPGLSWRPGLDRTRRG